MSNDLASQLLIFATLIVVASGLFGACIMDHAFGVSQYVYLFSAVFTDTVAYFVLQDAYEKYRNGHADHILSSRTEN